MFGIPQVVAVARFFVEWTDTTQGILPMRPARADTVSPLCSGQNDPVPDARVPADATAPPHRRPAASAARVPVPPGRGRA